MSSSKDEYVEGYDMSKLTHLPQVSVYNSNYYSNGRHLLFGKSDDDNETEWYLIRGSQQPTYLGYTYTNERERHLHKEGNL